MPASGNLSLNCRHLFLCAFLQWLPELWMCLNCRCTGALVTDFDHENYRHICNGRAELERVWVPEGFTEQGHHVIPGLPAIPQYFTREGSELLLYKPLCFGFSVKCIPFTFPFQVQIHLTEGPLCARHPTRHYHMSVPFNFLVSLVDSES